MFLSGNGIVVSPQHMNPELLGGNGGVPPRVDVVVCSLDRLVLALLSRFGVPGVTWDLLDQALAPVGDLVLASRQHRGQSADTVLDIVVGLGRGNPARSQFCTERQCGGVNNGERRFAA